MGWRSTSSKMRFGQAGTVNGIRYREMITNFLWPEIEDMDLDDMWFQQDDATCHTDNETMALLRKKFNGRIISCRGDANWPPRSCDFTPLDFFLWGYLKEKVYVNNPRTIQELMDEIIRYINDIEPQLCLRVIENMDHRVEVFHRHAEAVASIWPIFCFIHNCHRYSYHNKKILR